MLAKFFDKIREIIEAAETPFAKMAIFLLPILAPIVPATFTSLHIYKLLMDVFGDYGHSILATLAVIVGMVLEMLGYVGAIEFIHSVFRLVRNKGTVEYWLPAGLTFLAYVFYLAAMFLINVQLGKYFETAPIINSIVGLLSFITVPTGLLAANYLGNKSESEQDYILRQEKREDRLKAKAIKAGMNPFVQPATLNLDTPQVKEQRTKHASDYREQAIRFIEEYYGKNRTLPKPRHVTERFHLDHNNNKGYMSTLIKEVAEKSGWR